MTADLRDAEFVATVARERPLLQSAAYLLLDDPRTAGNLVDAVLARLYERGVPVGSLRLAALQALVGDDAGLTSLPWRSASRFELVDAELPTRVEPVVQELHRLAHDQRVVVVLAAMASLSSEEIAQVLKRPAAEVVALAQQAPDTLAVGHGTRSDLLLASELRAAVPAELRLPRSGFDDLVRGRRLLRRRWLRRGVSVAAALLLAVVLTTQLWPRPALVPSSAPPITNLPSAPISRPAPRCDTTDSACHATILSDWRSQMAAVADEYVDPTGSYFTGYSFSYDARYESPTIWSGRGRLGFDLFRLQAGGTQVYVQLATSPREAVRCGATTRTECVSQRFLDGNRFTLSQTSDVREGLEVQYCPNGDQVITVIARNTTQGRKLPITRGDLVRLVQDPRLRLPNL